MGILADLTPYNKVSVEQLESTGGLILSGGPRSVGREDSPKLPNFIEDILVSRSLPVLGICYGHQLLAHFCGGKLTRSHKEEYGKTTVQLHQNYISDKFIDSSKSEAGLIVVARAIAVAPTPAAIPIVIPIPTFDNPAKVDSKFLDFFSASSMPLSKLFAIIFHQANGQDCPLSLHVHVK